MTGGLGASTVGVPRVTFSNNREGAATETTLGSPPSRNVTDAVRIGSVINVKSVETPATSLNAVALRPDSCRLRVNSSRPSGNTLYASRQLSGASELVEPGCLYPSS